MKGTWDHFVVSLQLLVNLYLFQKNVKTKRNHMLFSDAYNSLINSNELSVN